MSKTLSILNPVVTVEIGGQTVEVRELAWPDALSFINRLKEQANALTDETGNLRVAAPKLMEAIGTNAELAGWLVCKSCRNTEMWLNERSLGEVLALVEAALEVNLGVIGDRLKNVRGRLAGIAAGAAKPTSNPTSPDSVKS